MAVLVWDDSFKLHIEAIDSQHRRLIDIVNELGDAVASGQTAGILGKVLAELLDYTQTHFAYEEKLLERHGYPAYPGHKAEHDALAEKVVFMSEMFGRGDSLDSGLLMNFLKVWLQEHILDMDKKYAPFLQAKGVQ